LGQLHRLLLQLQADVYSYAIILWELATKSSNLYPQFQFIHQITQFFVKGGSLLPSITNLMTSCWNDQPEFRPIFQEVLKTIQQSFNVDTTNQEMDS
jgi:hypothetical protein